MVECFAKIAQKKVLIFSYVSNIKKLLIFFQKKAVLIFREKETLKNFFMSHKTENLKNFPSSKFSKLKYFLIIIIPYFFSFYNIFFNTQQAFVFHLLRDFCSVNDHIVDFFLFLL